MKRIRQILKDTVLSYIKRKKNVYRTITTDPIDIGFDGKNENENEVTEVFKPHEDSSIEESVLYRYYIDTGDSICLSLGTMPSTEIYRHPVIGDPNEYMAQERNKYIAKYHRFIPYNHKTVLKLIRPQAFTFFKNDNIMTDIRNLIIQFMYYHEYERFYTLYEIFKNYDF